MFENVCDRDKWRERERKQRRVNSLDINNESVSYIVTASEVKQLIKTFISAAVSKTVTTSFHFNTIVSILVGKQVKEYQQLCNSLPQLSFSQQ